jgi:hypothetical protein
MPSATENAKSQAASVHLSPVQVLEQLAAGDNCRLSFMMAIAIYYSILPSAKTSRREAMCAWATAYGQRQALEHLLRLWENYLASRTDDRSVIPLYRCSIQKQDLQITC